MRKGDSDFAIKRLRMYRYKIYVLTVIILLLLIRLFNNFYFVRTDFIPNTLILVLLLIGVGFLWFEELRERKNCEYLINELQSIDEFKSNIISKLSHELRTPLVSMREFASIISDGIAGPLTENQKRYIQAVITSIDRLTRLINNLMDIEVLQNRKVFLHRKLTDAVKLIESEVEFLRVNANSKDVKLIVESGKNIKPIFIDQDKIAQVIINLVNNAIKFTPFYGNITVNIEDAGDNIKVSVSDTGKGIEKDELGKVFDRMHLSEKRKGQSPDGGMGLGLAISKEIIEIHRGNIWAESELGRGSKFIFTLPKLSEEDAVYEYITDLVASAKASDRSVSLILFKIDKITPEKTDLGDSNFKELIDLIKKVLLRSVRQTGDIVSSFKKRHVIIVSVSSSKKESDSFAIRIKKLLETESFKIDNSNLRITFKYNIVNYPEDGNTADELISNINKIIS